MDIRVQELLDKIKREGLESAEAEAAKIIEAAEAQKATIIANAEKEAKSIIEKAKEGACRSEESGKAALVQASRDLILAFRAEVEKTLAAIIKTEVSSAYGADTVKKVLPEILKACANDGEKDLSVLVPEKDLKELESWFKTELQAEMKKGVVLKPLKDSKDGFRISEKDGSAYYDFSAESVASMLSAYLNTKLSAVVAETVK